MTIDHAIAPSQLMAEIAEIDVLLMQYEDWRALLQLESREKQGDAVRSINGDTLKALLLESLSVNPLFARRQQLLAELERMARDLQRLGPRTETPEVAPALSDAPNPQHDDLTQIPGIDSRLAKRLKILNVRSFSQIANWTPGDVEYVANTLGLGDLIGTQNWIGQAAQLIQSNDTLAPASDVWSHARSDLRPPSPSIAAPVAAVPKSSVDVPKPVAETKAPSVVPSGVPPAVPAHVPATPAVDKPVAAVNPVAPIVAQPQPEPVAKALTPTPVLAPISTAAPAVSETKPVTAPIDFVVPAAAAADDDKSWMKLVPASPLAARVYKSESPPPAATPAAPPTLPQEPAKAVPVTEPLILAVPAKPLAARHYQGALLEPNHDGAIYGSLVPAKPLPAPAYRVVMAERPAVPVAPVPAAPTPPPAAQAVAAQPALTKPESKAADILQHTLPPLPLRPSAPPAQPPMTKVQSPAQPSGQATPAAVTSAQSEALLLAVVAARSPLVAGAAPPPLPVEAKNGKAVFPAQPASGPPIPPVTRPAPIAGAVVQPTMLDEVEPRSRQAAVEARVTIKRAEEALSNTVLRTPGGTEVHLGSRRGAQPDEFDGNSYAAYRGSIEEASVQIVRRPPATKSAPVTPDVPPPLTQALASAAQAAAQAIEASRLPVADSVESAAPAGSTMGRFLKALTGQ